MRETARPNYSEHPLAAQVRITSTQRLVLDAMEKKAYVLEGDPKRLELKRRTARALVEKQLAVEIAKDVFQITPAGIAVLSLKTGAPSKFTGKWAALSDHYRGPYELAKKVGVSYTSLRKWALLGHPPSGPARKMISILAQEAGVDDPLS